MSELNSTQFSLGTVYHNPEEGVAIEPRFPDINISVEDYSRFKYGDGAIARALGQQLARFLIPQLIMSDPESPIFVTSSAYKIAKPAAVSLVEPFVGVAQAVTFAYDSPARVVPFKINRGQLTDGDYATMSIEERRTIMKSNGLSLPIGVNVSGCRVVTIDDIRVTGSHEESVDTFLREQSVVDITHSYILDVASGTSDPTIEALINSTSMRGVPDLIEIARTKHFTPNARIGKYILTQDNEAITEFVNALSLRISSRIINDAIGDGLDQMDRYKDGFRKLVEAFSNRVLTDFESQ